MRSRVLTRESKLWSINCVFTGETLSEWGYQYVCACVWLPAGWRAGQWSSEADWLVDRLVEIIGQMTLELPHRETGTDSCNYSSYTQRENTHNQVIIKQQPPATFVVFVVFVLSVHLIVLIKRKNRRQCLRLMTNTVKSRQMLCWPKFYILKWIFHIQIIHTIHR